MSLTRQACRKRQSVQATYTVPAPSISAEGSGPSRRLPATVWCLIVAMVVTVIASLYPAWFASRSNPADALRVA